MKGPMLELISEIEKELHQLEELQGELKKIRSEKDIAFQRAKGSILHDFYNCCETIFKKIAVEMNSAYEQSETWHKSLLYKMTIPIEGLRPRVISDELAADLDEFLAFRHVFRNIYGFELKGDRIDYLAKKFDKVVENFRKELEGFLRFLRENLAQ